MSDTKHYGMIGESIAADFLRKSGCIIFKRNYRCRYGEIDLIAEKGDLLLFVEVKTRTVGALVSPAEAVNAAKKRRLVLTADDFLSKLSADYRCRFDVCEITVDEAKEKPYTLNYVKDAFIP